MHDETSDSEESTDGVGAQAEGAEGEPMREPTFKEMLSIFVGLGLIVTFLVFMFWPQILPWVLLGSQSEPPTEIEVGSEVSGSCADLTRNRYFAVTTSDPSHLTFRVHSHTTHWLVLRAGDMNSRPIGTVQGVDEEDDSNVYSEITSEVASGRYVVEIRPFITWGCVYTLTVEHAADVTISPPRR